MDLWRAACCPPLQMWEVFTFQGEFLVQDMKEEKKKPEHFSAEGYGIQRKQFFLTQCKAHNGAVMNEMGFL